MLQYESADRLRGKRRDDVLDLLIRGGSVVDGTGSSPFEGDIGIADGRIVAVGALRALHCNTIAQLFRVSTLLPPPPHPATAVLSGNCGLTLAPAATDDRDF